MRRRLVPAPYYGPAQVMVTIEETAKRRGYNLMFAGIGRPSKTQLAAAIEDVGGRGRVSAQRALET